MNICFTLLWVTQSEHSIIWQCLTVKAFEVNVWVFLHLKMISIWCKFLPIECSLCMTSFACTLDLQDCIKITWYWRIVFSLRFKEVIKCFIQFLSASFKLTQQVINKNWAPRWVFFGKDLFLSVQYMYIINVILTVPDKMSWGHESSRWLLQTRSSVNLILCLMESP